MICLMTMLFKLLFVIGSLCVNLGYVDVTPYNMFDSNTSGVGPEIVSQFRSMVSSNFRGWGESYGWTANVPDDDLIVTKGASLWGSYNGAYHVLVPREINNGNSSYITCQSFTYDDDDVVNMVSINFTNYVDFWVSSGYYVDNPYVAGYKSYNFTDEDPYQLCYCYSDIYCNNELVVTNQYIKNPVVVNGGKNDYVAPPTLTGGATSDISVDGSQLTTSSSSFLNNILGKISNSIAALNNNNQSGFSQLNNNIMGLFGNFFSQFDEWFTDFKTWIVDDLIGLPTAEECYFIFHNSMLGQQWDSMTSVYVIWDEFFRDWTVQSNDDFVINFSFTFFNQPIHFEFSFVDTFGNNLSEVRRVTSVFIYLTSTLLVIRALPSILGRMPTTDAGVSSSTPHSHPIKGG